MALLTTVLEVVGVIAAMAAFLWFSTIVEARQLGTAAVVAVTPEPAADELPADAAIESAPLI